MPLARFDLKAQRFSGAFVGLRAVRAGVRGMPHVSIVFTPLDSLSGEGIPALRSGLEL